MRNIADYSTFVNKTITLNPVSINTSINLDMYKKIIDSILKELNINLYFAATFGVSLTALLPVVERFVKTGIFNIELNTKNVILLTLCAVAVLTKENRKSVQLLFNLALKNNITDKTVDKLINQLTNLKVIFAIIAEQFGKVITTFCDMLAYTGLLIPFLNIINFLIDNKSIDTDAMIHSFKAFEITIGAIALKLLIEKISRKIQIITADGHKFQKKEQADILRKDEELKPDYLKTTKLKI